MDTVEQEVHGEVFRFLPGRAVYWPRRQLLMVADLHWGKAEIFQKAGIPVSSEILPLDLQRLKAMMDAFPVERLVLLGDLLHSPKGITSGVHDAVRDWRESINADIIFVRGNHDRKAHLPLAWRMLEHEDCYQDGSFIFSHEALYKAGSFTWCGHLHPVVHIGQRHDRLRLPCFWLQKNCGVLPSFGSFTGGFPIRPARHDRVLVIAEESVFDLELGSDS